MQAATRIFSGLSLCALLLWLFVVISDQTAPASPPPLTPLTGQIDRIIIEKSARRLMLYRAGDVVREYRVALGFAPTGDKVREGDGKTPEGIFTINRRNDASAYHLSLGLDYPRPEDIARATADGVKPGGDIFIHGQPNGLNRATAIAHHCLYGTS